MKKPAVLSLLFLAAASLPSIASAEILLKNRDGKSYQLTIRHPSSATTMSLPAGAYLVVTQGALSVQLSDGSGRAKGAPLEVADGDRLFVKNGRLEKQIETAEKPD